jgi:hypothetical protein
VKVSFEDYDDIMTKEVAKNSLIQELKSYEACIVQKEEGDNQDEEVRTHLFQFKNLPGTNAVSQCKGLHLGRLRPCSIWLLYSQILD